MNIQIYTKATFPYRTDRLIGELDSPLEIFTIFDGHDVYNGEACCLERLLRKDIN
jgi:hypothetical protein